MVITVVSIFHVLVAIGLIATVLLQSGKSAGLSGAVGGGAESFFGKKKGLEEKLERVTTILAVAFMITALVSVFLS
ncbi:MAG: preprotein translocase subunit SecG [bacterium]